MIRYDECEKYSRDEPERLECACRATYDVRRCEDCSRAVCMDCRDPTCEQVGWIYCVACCMDQGVLALDEEDEND